MRSDTLDKLNSTDYSIASNCLNSLLKDNGINKVDIRELLALDNTLIIGDFLEKYDAFDSEDLLELEEYINNNLDHSDRLFVSNLIEFATDWELSINYKKCIDFLGKYGDDDDYVVLASIDYVFENLRMAEIENIYRSLHSILNNPEQNRSTQIKAAFALFRITHRKEFLTDLTDLVVNGDENNKLLLKNILTVKYNSKEYFDYHDKLKAIL